MKAALCLQRSLQVGSRRDRAFLPPAEESSVTCPAAIGFSGMPPSGASKPRADHIRGKAAASQRVANHPGIEAQGVTALVHGSLADRFSVT